MRSRAFPSCRACRRSTSNWQPRQECASFSVVTTDVEMSGPLTGPVPDKDKKQRFTLIRTVEITDVGPEYFDSGFLSTAW